MRLHPARSFFVWTALYFVAALGSLPALADPQSFPDPACAYRLLHSFGKPGPGSDPRATLLQGSDGALYGTGARGGKNDFGVAFKINPDGTGYQVLVLFDGATNGAYPWAGLIQGSDGALYGTAPMGGAYGLGTAFKVNIDGTGLTVLKSFSGADTGSYPYGTLLQGADGALYGTASEGGTNGTGTIFKLNTGGSGFTVLMSFAGATTGAYPYSELIQAPDGTLYGTASSSGGRNFGTVFKIKTDGTGFTVVKNFEGGAGGASPWGAVLRGSNGSLYGTTTEGDIGDSGTIYRVNTDGSGFTVLNLFRFSQTGSFPATALIEGTGGVLYGTTSHGSSGVYGTVFKINLDGSGFATLTPLVGSQASGDRTGGVILGVDGALHGTTPGDDHVIGGTVYRLNTDGTDFTNVFASFSWYPDLSDGGSWPAAGVIRGTDGALYGVTTNGGTGGGGTVFRLQPDGTGFTVLKNLDHPFSGGWPMGELIRGADGALYGTTTLDGVSHGGTLFRLNPDGSGFSVLLGFPGGTTGASPMGIIQGVDGKLYGTTYGGWSYQGGTVFRVDIDGSNFTVLKQLGSVNGNLLKPDVGVIQGADGRIYGTAEGGPGAIFGLSSDGSGVATLRQMASSSGLTEGANGVLYGLTSSGGPGGAGTVFRINHNGSGYSVLHAFDSSGSGSVPSGELLLAADGKFYGTTRGGGDNNVGILFSMNPDGSGFTSIASFDLLRGTLPSGRLIQGNDGVIYGTHGRGGTVGGGTVFSFDTFVSQTPPVARCKDITVPSTSACTAEASIDDGSFDPDAGDRIERSQDPAGPFPVGDTLVTLSVTDRGCVTRTCTATVTVLPGTPCDDGNACTTSDQCETAGCVGGGTVNCDDGNCCTVDSCHPASGCAHAPYVTPPGIVVQPSLDGGGGSCPALWPPNHGYVDLNAADTGIEAVSTCGGVTYTFASCESSEAEDQPGSADGNTVRDCVFEPGALHLRAERDGTCSPKGRSYTMTMIATDACGNPVTSSPFTACVWHDKQNAPGSSQGNIYGATAGSGGNDSRPGTNGTYGAACGAGCGLVCDESGQVHDSSDDDRPNLTLTLLSGGGVRLDWSLPAPNDPYPPNANYEVWRRVRGQTPYEKLAELPPSVTTYSDAAAADGIDYEWSVNALY